MKQKTYFRLGALIGTLLVLAYLAGAFEPNASTVETRNWKFAPDEVQTVVLIDPPDTLRLQRTPSGWQVVAPVKARADSVALRQLFFALRDLEIEHVVSRRPERYTRYGVDSTAPQVGLIAASRQDHIYIGRPGPDPGSRFIRFADAPEVWLARTRLDISARAESWIDRTVAMLPETTLAGITVTTPEEHYRAERDSTGWHLITDEGSLPPDSVALYTWLRRLAPLRADAIVLDSTRTPERLKATATHRLIVTRMDGSRMTIYGLKEGTELYLTADGRSSVYRMPAYRTTWYWPPLQRLKQQRPTPSS